MIDMKYQQQMTALEKKGKPNNPLTKRLLQKVQSEWTTSIEKKKEEFRQKSDGEDIDNL
jgi:Holliday junction resolvase RusA-like endonuclease